MMKMEPDEKINSAMSDFNMLLQTFTGNPDIKEILLRNTSNLREGEDQDSLIPDRGDYIAYPV